MVVLIGTLHCHLRLLATSVRADDGKWLRHAEPRRRGRRVERALQHLSALSWIACRWNIFCWTCAVMRVSSVGSLVETTLKEVSLHCQTIFLRTFLFHHERLAPPTAQTDSFSTQSLRARRRPNALLR